MSRLRDRHWLAELLGVPTGTIGAWVHRREIPHVKIGRVLRFDEDEIHAWLEAKRVAAAAVGELAATRDELRARRDARKANRE